MPSSMPSRVAPGMHVHVHPLMRVCVRACAGARIHSNSWGANVNAYTLPTADVDEFMHSFDEMLILFAAGNSGQEGPGSIGAPATCKNCLTVGASENNMPENGLLDGNVAYFSSQGPAVGNRYKPDVVAPGFSVNSANSNSERQGRCCTVCVRPCGRFC